MGREIIVIESYRATVSAVDHGSPASRFSLNCYSADLEQRGIKYRYEVFLDAPRNSYSLIYWLQGSGSLDRRIIAVLNMEPEQLDRAYLLLSTEKPVRIRIEHDGGNLLDEDQNDGYRRVSEAKIYTGLEPVGEGEDAVEVFPE
ncbi:MAG: hypothetical protein AAGI70_17605 [Pseudomonadota bacterium]